MYQHTAKLLYWQNTKRHNLKQPMLVLWDWKLYKMTIMVMSKKKPPLNGELNVGAFGAVGEHIWKD